jgi:hypothetical protein
MVAQPARQAESRQRLPEQSHNPYDEVTSPQDLERDHDTDGGASAWMSSTHRVLRDGLVSQSYLPAENSPGQLQD